MNINFDYLTTLTLVWFIYTFLLGEADKQLLELLNRLKFALSVSDKGVIERSQLIASEKFSFIEMHALKIVIKDKNHHKYRNIENALPKYESVNKWKKVLLANIFLLTVNVVFNLFYQCNILLILLKIHMIVSLIISICFYYFCINSIQEVIFIGIKESTDGDRPQIAS